MKKKKLNHLLHHPEEADESDLKQILVLQNEYPFSQVIHAIAAKMHLIKNTSIGQSKLSHAAIYSGDRSVLKAYIQGDSNNFLLQSHPRIQPSPSKIKVDTPPQKSSKFKEIKPLEPWVSSEHDLEMDKIREDVISNALKLRKNFDHYNEIEDSIFPEKKQDPIKEEKTESTESPTEAPVPKEETVKEVKKKATTRKTSTAKKTASTKKVAPKKKTPASKKSATSKKTVKETPAKKEVPPPAKSTSKKASVKEEATPTDDDSELTYSLVHEYVIPPSPLGPKQEEQNEVIRAFIANNPKISAPKVDAPDIDEETQDLARESVSFKDDLISENLAVIMAKQGKKSKAIDIYKKLIWKYPQKKAYFATQIENLENN